MGPSTGRRREPNMQPESRLFLKTFVGVLNINFILFNASSRMHFHTLYAISRPRITR